MVDSDQKNRHATRKVRVLIAHQHPFVLEGLRACLKGLQQFEIVGATANGQEVTAKCRELSPDVIVMSISMPFLNGLEATRHLRRIAPRVRILILDLANERELASKMIEAGASGCLARGSSPAELLRALESLSHDETYFSRDVKEAFLKRFIQEAGRPNPSKEVRLSVREREVLALTAQGCSTKDTASLLGVSVRTIEKHRERVRGKLHLHSLAQLTKYAIENQMVQMS